MPELLTNDNIMSALSRVKDPEIGRDLVSLGMVREIEIDGAAVALTVELTTPACPLKDQINSDISRELESLGAAVVKVDWASNVKRSFGGPAADLIPGVKNTIAVASGKGIRAMTNPVATVIADPFYSGASLMTTKFLKERPEVARKVVAAIDEATDLVNTNFEKYKPILTKYTPTRPDQLELIAQPYLRGFKDMNETDLKSYQALVDVFVKDGVIGGPINVRDKLLAKSDLGN